MRLKRRPLGPLTPLPPELVGIGIVEDWVDPAEGLPDDLVQQQDEGRRGALGDTVTQHVARLLAERRLEQARSDWESTERPYEAPTSGAIARRRPTPGEPTAEQVEILERRRWALAGHSGARCAFLDRRAW